MSKHVVAIRVRTLVVLAVLLLAGAAAFVYFGVYDVAATEQHTAPVYHLLHYAMTRSVKARADGIPVPDLSNASRTRRGFVLYQQHCVQCHGAPGVEPGPVGFGVRPAPVNLVEAAREWQPAEIYWVVKHGIKLTGMAAWEYRLSDQELWDITAFVKMLPTVAPQQYKEWSRAEPPPQPVPMQAGTGATLGSAAAGKHAIEQYLCVTCHRIPGVTGADKDVGPTLAGIARRKYIGGVLENSPENMIRWLRNPQEIDPLSAMPNLHIKERDLRDIAAYLYTLDQPEK